MNWICCMWPVSNLTVNQCSSFFMFPQDRQVDPFCNESSVSLPLTFVVCFFLFFLLFINWVKHWYQVLYTVVVNVSVCICLMLLTLPRGLFLWFPKAVGCGIGSHSCRKYNFTSHKKKKILRVFCFGFLCKTVMMQGEMDEVSSRASFHTVCSCLKSHWFTAGSEKEPVARAVSHTHTHTLSIFLSWLSEWINCGGQMIPQASMKYSVHLWMLLHHNVTSPVCWRAAPKS